MREQQDVSDPDDIRATFIFHPPINDAAAWHMTLEGFVHALTASFPAAFTKHRTSQLRDNPVVDFEIEIQPGIWIEGVASTPVENSAVITLVGATVSEAARFAQWLRTTLVPAASPICFSSEAALDSGDTTEWHIPADGDFDEIRTVVAEHRAAHNDE
ncbi:hypothetical protein ACFYNY_23455 [Streptomyces sp. NPDC006530]|uniref:hypothetical protein n=1 Tax=Streptomyces sp. NPDC006530 TaxID=3364750 RepID=UPI00368067C5